MPAPMKPLRPQLDTEPHHRAVKDTPIHLPAEGKDFVLCAQVLADGFESRIDLVWVGGLGAVWVFDGGVADADHAAFAFAFRLLPEYPGGAFVEIEVLFA